MTSDPERGTGRSTRQILAAPDEFIFVVYGWKMINFSRTLQRRHAPEKMMDVVTTERVREKCTGTNILIIVDHDAWPHLSEYDTDFIYQHNSRLL